MYLLDTHAIYWSLYDSSKLPDEVKRIIEEEDCCISIASLWEMSIKASLGKLHLNLSCAQVAETFESNGISLLEITPEDCDRIKQLPMIHRDPFDRILIAQALSNDCTLVTKDQYIPQYDVKTVW